MAATIPTSDREEGGGGEKGRSSFRVHELSSCNISTRGLREVFFFFFFFGGEKLDRDRGRFEGFFIREKSIF